MKVYLATWYGPGTLTAWDENFDSGVQREVSADFAKKMEGHRNLEIIHVEEGSKEDVRVPEYVVPPQPEDLPVEESDWPVGKERETIEGKVDPPPVVETAKAESAKTKEK